MKGRGEWRRNNFALSTLKSLWAQPKCQQGSLAAVGSCWAGAAHLYQQNACSGTPGFLLPCQRHRDCSDPHSCPVLSPTSRPAHLNSTLVKAAIIKHTFPCIFVNHLMIHTDKDISLPPSRSPYEKERSQFHILLFQSNSIRTVQTNWSLKEFPVSCLTDTVEVKED